MQFRKTAARNESTTENYYRLSTKGQHLSTSQTHDWLADESLPLPRWIKGKVPAVLKIAVDTLHRIYWKQQICNWPWVQSWAVWRWSDYTSKSCTISINSVTYHASNLMHEVTKWRQYKWLKSWIYGVLTPTMLIKSLTHRFYRATNSHELWSHHIEMAFHTITLKKKLLQFSVTFRSIVATSPICSFIRLANSSTSHFEANSKTVND